jgi:putative membrane protein
VVQENTECRDPSIELAHDRTDMANFRTQLALDRTALAWVRTSLTFATFGFAIAGFTLSTQDVNATDSSARIRNSVVGFGALFVIVGILLMLLSGIAHWRALRRLRKGQPPKLAWFPLSLVVAGLVILLGIVGLIGIFSQ